MEERKYSEALYRQSQQDGEGKDILGEENGMQTFTDLWVLKGSESGQGTSRLKIESLHWGIFILATSNNTPANQLNQRGLFSCS